MTNTYQWYWKSNANPFSDEETAEWQEYSDIEMNIIEDAFQEHLSRVELDDYEIDLVNFIQFHKQDSTRQRPIKRVSARSTRCGVSKRFSFQNENSPMLKSKSMMNDGRWETPYFIEEWIKRNPEVSMSEQVEMAADGILKEGIQLGTVAESKWLAEALRSVKDKDFNDIAIRCIYLYTRECFLYKLLNRTLRNEDLSKIDTLGPFCDILWNSLGSEELRAKYQFTGTVYRGASMISEDIEDYQNNVKKPLKKWLNFSSTSKNQALAEMYGGNTLLIIHVPSQSQHLDISSISHFPEEEEVLLGASTTFQVENVQLEEATGKYHVHLRILW